MTNRGHELALGTGDGAVPLLEGHEANVLSKDRKRAPQVPHFIKLVNSETPVCF